MNKCMYACVYVCMSVRLYAYMYVCMYVCMYVRTYVRMYVCLYVCMYMRVCVGAHTHIPTYYIYIHIIDVCILCHCAYHCTCTYVFNSFIYP